MVRFLALFGFAPSAEQVARPPVLAYLVLLAAGYFSAHLLEWLSWGLRSAGLSEISVYLRTVGVVSALLVAHAFYRAVVHRDDNSWGGIIRKYVM